MVLMVLSFVVYILVVYAWFIYKHILEGKVCAKLQLRMDLQIVQKQGRDETTQKTTLPHKYGRKEGEEDYLMQQIYM